jgi:DNA-binding NtrC family response regulator
MGSPSADDPKTQRRWGLWKGKLLVVDEDVEDLQHYSAILNQLGYEVRTFASYCEAVACLGQEVFDLVVVTQGTSRFEGRSVLARAIENDRCTPVLVLTHCVDIPCYLEAIQLGARDYMLKPLPPSEIGELVAKHLPSRSGPAQIRAGHP